MLRSQAKHLLMSHVHVAILIGARTVEHNDERQLGLAIPSRRNVQSIRHVSFRRCKVIRSVLVSLCPQLGSRSLFCKLLRFGDLPIGIQSRTERDESGLLRDQPAGYENEHYCGFQACVPHLAAARFSEKKVSTFAAKRAAMRFPWSPS